MLISIKALHYRNSI